MTRISRCLLVIVLTAALALVSVPFVGARPLETSQGGERTESGWIGAALGWLESLVKLHYSALSRHGRATSMKDDATPTGGSCVDPEGHPRPWCL